MPITAESIALVTATYFFAGIVKGVTGLGVPIIGVAFTAPVIGMQAAVALVLGPSVLTNVWQAVVGGHMLLIIRRIWPLLLTSCIGIWFGSGVLAAADGQYLLLFLGALLIVYSVIALVRARLPSPGRHEGWLTPVLGVPAGIVYGMTGSYMVPGTLYIQSLGMPRDMFVQALGIAFVIVSLMLSGAMIQRAILTPELIVMTIGAVAPCVVGMLVGQRMRKILTEEQFTRIVLIVILLTGVYMIARVTLQV
ncbi:MAG: sulfite exporter TauE/SafE family protein [Pseudomonadota bacterium]